MFQVTPLGPQQLEDCVTLIWPAHDACIELYFIVPFPSFFRASTAFRAQDGLALGMNED